jgi:hypothetical protein
MHDGILSWDCTGGTGTGGTGVLMKKSPPKTPALNFHRKSTIR